MLLITSWPAASRTSPAGKPSAARHLHARRPSLCVQPEIAAIRPPATGTWPCISRPTQLRVVRRRRCIATQAERKPGCPQIPLLSPRRRAERSAGGRRRSDPRRSEADVRRRIERSRWLRRRDRHREPRWRGVSGAGACHPSAASPSRIAGEGGGVGVVQEERDGHLGEASPVSIK
ncbi:hypothetical protein DAI22_07g190400 [Oryza sativa Japonica Group]|nr:hypothetical protein DAI22_07g190400 [Oryza sativa Japonica Group]